MRRTRDRLKLVNVRSMREDLRFERSHVPVDSALLLVVIIPTRGSMEDFERCFVSCMMRETSTTGMRELIDTVSQGPSGTGKSIILLHVQK